MSIQRLNYFTGLFLDENDFITEQDYHLKMRRGINFSLFNSGILSGLDVDRVGTDSIRVDPGMAVDRYLAENQGREIVLTESKSVSLTGPTIADGDHVYIVISYSETQTNPKPFIPSRWTEEPVIKPIKEDPVLGFTGDPNLEIILAKVQVGSLSDPDLRERRLAELRLGGGNGGAGPSIDSIAFNNPPRQGSSVTMTINGANLGNNPVVTILDNSDIDDTKINPTIDGGASSNSVLVVNLAIAADAALGGRKVRIQTDGGSVTSGADAFTVIPPAPVISGISEDRGRQTVTVPTTIAGSNLAANPVVTILNNDDTVDTDITPTITTIAPDGSSLTVDLAIGATAVPGGRKVRVRTDGGTVTSAANIFTVVPAPVVKTLAPNSQVEGATIQVRGADIRDPLLGTGDPAAGTTVRFVDPGDSTNFVDGINPTVMSNITIPNGPQRVRVEVPSRGSLPSGVDVIVIIENATSNAITFTFA